MAKVGQWGKEKNCRVRFIVNANKQLSFTNMKRTAASRWATHNIVGRRPKMEYLGPDLDEITMDIIFDAEMGVNPRKEMKKLRVACRKGEAHYLWIGGRKVRSARLYIKSVSESWDRIWNKGELVRCVVSVTFGEYR